MQTILPALQQVSNRESYFRVNRPRTIDPTRPNRPKDSDRTSHRLHRARPVQATDWLRCRSVLLVSPLPGGYAHDRGGGMSYSPSSGSERIGEGDRWSTAGTTSGCRRSFREALCKGPGRRLRLPSGRRFDLGLGGLGLGPWRRPWGLGLARVCSLRVARRVATRQL